MNQGIDRAQGEYLLFLNGGDWLAADATLAAFFAERPTADILYGDEMRFYPDLKTIELRRTPPPLEIDKLFFAFDDLNHQAAFFRRELFTRFGLFNENYPMVADREKWIVFAENGCTFAKVEAGVSIYRLDGLSSRPENFAAREKEKLKIRAKYYTPIELRATRCARKLRHTYCRKYIWGGNRTFSVFAIDETRDQCKRKYRILNIPILKRRLNQGNTEYLLFGFVRIW
jgi:hypothetical protein